MSVQYDAFGRTTSYADADANTSTTTYDIDSNIATFTDGKGTTTFTYDGLDASGKTERRGLPTKADVTGVGAFTGAYNADATLVYQTYPGGLSATWRYDNAGTATSLAYGKGGATWLTVSSGDKWVWHTWRGVIALSDQFRRAIFLRRS